MNEPTMKRRNEQIKKKKKKKMAMNNREEEARWVDKKANLAVAARSPFVVRPPEQHNHNKNIIVHKFKKSECSNVCASDVFHLSCSAMVVVMRCDWICQSSVCLCVCLYVSSEHRQWRPAALQWHVHTNEQTRQVHIGRADVRIFYSSRTRKTDCCWV